MAVKKILELTPAQLARFEKCYGVYRKKKDRGVAETMWSKYDFDDDMTHKIYLAILAQNKQDNGETPTKFIKGFSVYLNNNGWVMDMAEQNRGTQASTGHHTCVRCSNETLVKQTLCKVCWVKYVTANDPVVKVNLAKQGVFKQGDTRGEVREKCREYLMKSGYTPAAVKRELERRNHAKPSNDDI